MANLYESMNKYFESKYGDDLDNVKKVEKKSLNEALLLEKKLSSADRLVPHTKFESEKEKKQESKIVYDTIIENLESQYGLKGKALNIVLKWFFEDPLPKEVKQYVDRENHAKGFDSGKLTSSAFRDEGMTLLHSFKYAPKLDWFKDRDPKELEIVKASISKNAPETYKKWFGGDVSSAEQPAGKKMGEGIRSRKAMKEAKDPSNFPVAKALTAAGIKMNGDINSPAAARELADKVIGVLEDAKKDASKSDVAQFDRAIDIVKKRKNSPALLLTTIGTFYTGYKSSAGVPEKKDECVDAKPVFERMSRKSRMREGFRNNPYYHAIKRVMNGDAKAADIVYEWYRNEEAFEDFTNAKDFEDYVRDDIYAMLDAADEVDKIKIVRKALGEEDWDEADGFDESVRTSKFKINRRKVESLKSAPKRHKLGESKVIVSRKAMKEDLGEDIARYQRYVDYDMKHYGKISKKTQDLIDKAGLQVVKDQYGDYEVTAGHYEEACRSHKPVGRMQERKNLDECDCEDCTCDGACTCTDEHSCCGEGKRSHEVVREAKKKEPDLWETIYGDLTDDGTQRINPETGHPYINLGAGYNYQDQVAVDRAGNIVVKTKEERDLKAAIDIADKYKDKGVTYNIDQSKYDKKYPYWMTIEIPEEYKECFKESKLTEKNWEYTVSNSVSREFRDAIQSDDEDYERVRRAIIAVYDDIHENAPELLDDSDYEEWVTEEAGVIDLDEDDDVNYLLTHLYDFCDNANIWIGI